LDLAAHDEVAEERLFSVPALKRKLKKAGFLVQRIDMHGFMGSPILPERWHSSRQAAARLVLFQRIMKRLPLLRLLGSSMTVTASKGETHIKRFLSVE
jgi:lactam utilization protein B